MRTRAAFATALVATTLLVTPGTALAQSTPSSCREGYTWAYNKPTMWTPMEARKGTSTPVTGRCLRPGTSVTVTLHRKGDSRPVTGGTVTGTVAKDGRVEVWMPLSKRLDSGTYQLQMVATAASGSRFTDKLATTVRN